MFDIRDIILSDDEKLKYPFLNDILSRMNNYSSDENNDREKTIDILENCLTEFELLIAECLHRDILLGNASIVAPECFNDWTDSENKKLNDRKEIINNLIYFSSIPSDMAEKTNSSYTSIVTDEYTMNIYAE